MSGLVRTLDGGYNLRKSLLYVGCDSVFSGIWKGGTSGCMMSVFSVMVSCMYTTSSGFFVLESEADRQ
jgi:hypothetical protein